MLIGYARVSKADGSQVLNLQIDALVQAGVSEERIYQDRVSGKTAHRPGLDACLKALQPENTLIVWKLDRLGRALAHLISTIDDLRKQRHRLCVDNFLRVESYELPALSFFEGIGALMDRLLDTHLQHPSAAMEKQASLAQLLLRFFPKSTMSFRRTLASKKLYIYTSSEFFSEDVQNSG